MASSIEPNDTVKLVGANDDAIQTHYILCNWMDCILAPNRFVDSYVCIVKK